MHLSMLLEMAEDAFGERVVVGRRLTGVSAARLQRLAVGGAALIREAGADALLYLDVNGPGFPAALFAGARAGVPLVPLNYRLGAEQLRTLVAKHPGAIAIADARQHGLLAELGVGARTAEDWLVDAESRGDDDTPTRHTDDPAVVIYTSGTTSEPKGVLLRHHNLVSYVLGAVEFGGASATEASLVSVPPYHIAAVANALTNLYAGRRTIVLEQFTGAEWLQLVRAEQITHALVVPTMLAGILGADGDRSVPTLRSLAYGGAAMPVRVIEEALQLWTHVDFVNAYGLTETSSTISVLGPEQHRDALATDDPSVRARLGSAGVPVPQIEIQVRDAQGLAVPPGSVGRIFVRGDQVSGEYAGTGVALDADGFFDTRDEGFLDDAGFLFVGGRADDTIIRGGENIAPAEVEETLLAYEGVSEAVVVGVPDPRWGQHLEAVVVAAPGVTLDPEAVRDHVRRHLRSSKTPDRIVVWDRLPRTDLGKLVRRRVIDRIVAETTPR